MECSEVKQWLAQSRSFAKSQEDAPSVEMSEHLTQCSDCLKRWKEEQSFDGQVHRAMHEVNAPSYLEQAIEWRLRQARRQRQRSRVLYGSLAAAAAFLLAVCLNWYFQRPYDLAYLNETV